MPHDSLQCCSSQRVLYNKVFVNLCTLVTFSVGMTTLIGCAMWNHPYGIGLSSLLVAISICRAVVLLVARFTGTGVPLWLALELAVPSTPSREVYTEVNNAEEEKEASCCTARKAVFRFRVLLEFVLFLIVVVQLWARYAKPNNPHVTEWSDIHDVNCTDSPDNCYVTEFGLPDVANFGDAARACTRKWIHKMARTDLVYYCCDDGDLPLWHVRVLSRVFPFPDDFVAQLNVANTSARVHSAARLGKSDFGVNKHRSQNYQEYMETCLATQIL
eukprot:TRINITY_DN28868_c0_g1_i1.p1 TRINITY_DN28868_c0_g1~~TRINITY_DN28868_c0_g1_i1.p1  ORF type:complete len:284 (+),score=42.09 TRINITY_DN28868_c0_g1_i1:36-854(+)